MSGNLTLQAFESKFQSLQFNLALNISSRLKTRLLGDFLNLLHSRENQILNQSYYQELLIPLLEFSRTENLEFQPLKTLLALDQTFDYLDKSTDFETNGEVFPVRQKTVREQFIWILFSMGSYQEASDLLRNDSDEVPTFTIPEDIHSFADLFSLVEKQYPNTDFFKAIENVKEKWVATSQAFSHQEVWIPLVEKFEESPGKEVIVGTLHSLSVDLEARQTDKTRDLISFNNHPVAKNDLVHYQAQDAIQAARGQHKFLSKPISRRFLVMFGFPATDYFYTGSSFGVGMSLLSLCGFEREANLRKQYSISKQYAMTGGIDLTGKVRAVDPIGLQEKIKAVFFSPLSGMIIPRDNLEVGNEIVAKLSTQYPQRGFSLIAVARLEEILEQPRVSKYAKMPLMEWVKNHLTRSKIIQIITFFLLTVILTLTSISILKDTNPSSYKVEGEKVLIFNNVGKFLWDIELGHSPQGLESSNQNDAKYRRLQIHDLDGDGENEVVLGTAVKSHEFNGRLYFIETDGEVKWIFSDHPLLNFGGNIYSDNYGVGFIFPLQHPGSQTHDIYTRFSHMPWFPNRLVRFDIEGNVLDEFIHPGQIYDMEFIDLDRNGEMEMLLAGTNNGYNDAFLAILPSRGYSGTAPAWDNGRILTGGTIDSNLVYIKFPHWGKYDITGTNARTHVNDIHIDSDDGFIVSTVLGGSAEIGSYMYHFNHELELIGLSVSDGFLGKYHKEYGIGFFEKFDKEEWYDAISQLDVWRNGEWVKR